METFLSNLILAIFFLALIEIIISIRNEKIAKRRAKCEVVLLFLAAMYSVYLVFKGTYDTFIGIFYLTISSSLIYVEVALLKYF